MWKWVFAYEQRDYHFEWHSSQFKSFFSWMNERHSKNQNDLSTGYIADHRILQFDWLTVFGIWLVKKTFSRNGACAGSSYTIKYFHFCSFPVMKFSSLVYKFSTKQKPILGSFWALFPQGWKQNVSQKTPLHHYAPWLFGKRRTDGIDGWDWSDQTFRWDWVQKTEKKLLL